MPHEKYKLEYIEGQYVLRVIYNVYTDENNWFNTKYCGFGEHIFDY